MKFALKPGVMYEIRRLPKVQSAVRSVTERISDACGSGYEWSDQQGQSRWRGAVRPRSWAAKQDNATNNTLVRELNRARL